jgi:SAM-dependent methyltransferase
LYDLSEDETSEISISFDTASQATPSFHKRMSSLVIPSPTSWPTIQNYQKALVDAPLLSPMRSPAIVTPNPRLLSALAARPMDSTSSAPSLDGSLTSEELSNLSCPSTPDLERKNRNGEWSSPVQLHPRSLQTLSSIVPQEHAESPIIYAGEMKEVTEQRPALALDVAVNPAEVVEDELSALSVPSPGGFFSTLEPSTRHTWQQQESPVPTGIAEQFYGVPWASIHEQIIEYEDTNVTEGPPTARRVNAATPHAATPRTATVPVTETTSSVVDPSEYKDGYAQELEAMSHSNFDRTSMWLREQECYGDDSASIRSASSSSSGSTQRQRIASIEKIVEEDEEFIALPTPKSVHFAEDVRSEPEHSHAEQIDFEKSAVFIDAAFENYNTTKRSDAFVQRKARTDKLRLDRRCLFSTHVNRLEGIYEVTKEEPKARRPMSDMFGPETTEESAAMAATLAKRRALEEIKPISWNLEATKMLNGGSLLTSPTGKLMPRIENGRVLDLGGLSTCDWAWQVALEHPSCTVTTVHTSLDTSANATVQGPPNHRVKEVPNLWTLPYADNSFHVISARNLMALLKTHRPNNGQRDEYDLVLRECLRILKPGGYLEFALLDSDIVHAAHGTQAHRTAVEFGFNLRTRGYDPSPTKLWLPRLRRAGFAQVRRAWLNLPLAQAEGFEGSTADASHISGMVGSWAWERWMVKLHREMGRDGDMLLEGVPAALEEGSRMGASWRYLSGWARKPF